MIETIRKNVVKHRNIILEVEVENRDQADAIIEWFSMNVSGFGLRLPNLKSIHWESLVVKGEEAGLVKQIRKYTDRCADRKYGVHVVEETDENQNIRDQIGTYLSLIELADDTDVDRVVVQNMLVEILDLLE